jgi:TolB protein
MPQTLLYYDGAMEIKQHRYLLHQSHTLLALAIMSMGLVMFILVLPGCHFTEDDSKVPPIIFLGWDENEQNQIYRQKPGGEPGQITRAEGGVFDFAAAPDGKTVIYTTIAKDGTSVLWQTDENGRTPTLLHTCAQAECSQPIWAPDNRRLIYERRNIGDDGIPGSSYLWWLDTETGESRAVLEDIEARGTAARFSPDGQWLSYISPEEEGAIIYNLKDGRSHFAADEIGVPVAWSPTGNQVVVPNLDLVIIHGDEGDDHLQHTHDYETAVHLFTMDIGSGDLRIISEDLKVEDSVPIWSPNGDWIAFGRRFPGTSAGRQLWLMRPDGSEARALTNDPANNYGPPSWSPDGRYLLFQRFAIDDPNGEPGIWLLDVETGQESELASAGMQPAWLVETSGD